MSGTPDPDEVTLRVAVAGDRSALEALDRRCFPPDDPALQPAAAGELDEGLATGSVLVAEAGGQLVGFVQWSVSDPRGGYFLSSLAVHPDHRRLGVAGRLLADALRRLALRAPEEGVRVATVTAPSNLAMIRCLTSAGFVGTTFLGDYFGPGHDRVHFDLQPADRYTSDPDVAFVPAEAPGLLAHLLSGDDHQLVGVVRLPHGEHLRVARRVALDDGAALGNEVSVGASFAGTMLASLIFLFGFALVDADVTGDLVAAVGAAVLLTTLSLLAYANASGELARVRTGTIHEFMRLGNLWSEYGAVYPLLVLTPAIVVVATGGSAAGGAIAASASVLILLYERSSISLTGRFTTQRVAWVTLGLLFAALPVLAAVCWAVTGVSWPWTLGFATVTLAALALGTRRSEPSGRARGPALQRHAPHRLG